MSPAALMGLLTLVVGVPLNVYITLRLWQLHREAPELRTLRERLIVAVAVLGLTLIFGLVFLNNDQPKPPLSLDVTKIVTRVALLAVAIVPALYWAWLYRRSK